MDHWYNYSWMDIVEKLQSDERLGLSLDKINSIKVKSGSNRIFNIEQKKSGFVIKKIILQPWFIMLIITALLMMVCKNYLSGIFLFFFTITSNLIYQYDDLNKAKNIKQLMKIDDINASVLRDGRTYMIPAEELVVGDIVFMQKGSVVPADIRIIELENLKVKQTSVTGEIYEVEKYSTKIEEIDISLIEMRNMLFKSTIVIDGSCVGIVTAIGVETEVGKIVRTLFEDNKRVEKFENFFNTTKKVLEIVAFLSAIMVASISIIMGNNINLIINKITLIITSSSPLVLIIILSSFFLLIKKTFNKNGILIKSISSIEVASTINSIYVEKLGFFYENEMSVCKLYTGGVIKDFSEKKIELTKNVERMIHISLLCNNNSKNNVEEKALIEFAKKANIEKAYIDVLYRRIVEVPFDLERGLKTTVNKVEKHYRANVVGAVDKVLEKCKFILKNGIEYEMTKEDIENIKLADIDMSTDSLSVIALANRNFKYAPSKDENIESYLVFVGLMGLKGTLKEESKIALKQAEEKDFITVISSEDSKLTTLSLGNEIGTAIDSENVLCGVEIENMDDAALSSFIARVKMLSRISINEKLRVLKSLKVLKNNILVTGTKLTDLPLLKAGDLRIAFGANCSSTIKATADAFIENENFEKILFYLKESKPTYIKFIKFLKYSFAISLTQGTYIIFYCIFNNRSVNIAYSTLWINMVFVLISFIYFYFKKYYYRFYQEPEKKIYFSKIVFVSLLSGFFSFAINGLIWNSSSLEFVLPLMELIFINKRFNEW
ncbi:MAG: cation-transporting P-type ATPase [Clostridiaceae bacterium]|nr:cation-transporting P-type ATPase [Clostridiaceae bacterium]